MIEIVVKRDGREEPFSADKLNKWAEFATEQGGDWAEIARQTFKRLSKKATSQDIHQTMIDVCLAKQTLEYSRVAARLELAELRKNINYILKVDPFDSSFKDILEALEDMGVWDSAVIPAYNPEWETWYDEFKQYPMEFWQLKQWTDKYSQRIDDIPVETPAIGFIGIALALFGDTIKAYDYAKALVAGQINLPTPALNGLRNGDWDTISCCVISAEDSTDSIGVANWIAYRMTAKKAGIGIEYTTRSVGDKVKGGRVKHLGKHPIYKCLDREVKVLTQITRGGNATVTSLAIDPEIEEIILWRSQRKDIETRIDKLDNEFGYNDAFLKAVIEDSDWYLFSYGDAPEVYKSFYVDSADDYNEVVKQHIAAGVKHKKIKARDLLKTYLTVRQETGRFYDNNLTRTNTHTPFLDVIKQSNLCVAPETKILTKNGYETISELEGETVSVWNGEEWSKVTVKKTGENQKLIRVVTNSGQELECTPYHKFYVVERTAETTYKTVEKRAHELKAGDRLIKFNLPVIQGEKRLAYPYENGIYTGDGCLTASGKRIYLYHEKRALKKHMADIFRTWNVQENLNRESGASDYLLDKFFVPTSEYTVEDRVLWFAGLMDADGCVARNGKTQSLQLSSTNHGFLLDVQMMLQTLGVLSKVVKGQDAGFREMPTNDGTGRSKEYYCKESFRLLIGQTDINKLQALGFKPHRLMLTDHVPNRESTQYIKVAEVIDEGRVDDTYCFTEPKRGMGMFNGILTGQCEEICLPTKGYESMEDLYSPTSKGETAFCSLSAINVANVSPEEYEKIAALTLEAVDIMIDNAPMMTESMKKDIMTRRSVGIGITGLASALYKQGYDYDGSEQSLDYVQALAERHYYMLLKASQALAERDGYSVEGIKKDWLPIDTAIRQPVDKTLDWEALRGKPRKHSVLVAHMPTESSSLLSGKSNSLYPPRKKVINKRSRQGLVQFICVEFDENKHKVAWDIDNITLSKYYARVQDYTDQAISADFYFDPAKWEDEKVPMSVLMKEWVAHAKLGNKTKYYLNTNDYNNGSFQDSKKAENEVKGVADYLKKETVVKQYDAEMVIEQEEDGCQGGCKL